MQNVQEGQDDCKPYYVDRKGLLELKSICERVLADNSLARELLPTQAGFFFGSTEYDEWYFNDIRGTVEIIDKALTLPDAWDFQYQSSW